MQTVLVPCTHSALDEKLLLAEPCEGSSKVIIRKEDKQNGIHILPWQSAPGLEYTGPSQVEDERLFHFHITEFNFQSRLSPYFQEGSNFSIRSPSPASSATQLLYFPGVLAGPTGLGMGI